METAVISQPICCTSMESRETHKQLVHVLVCDMFISLIICVPMAQDGHTAALRTCLQDANIPKQLRSTHQLLINTSTSHLGRQNMLFIFNTSMFRTKSVIANGSSKVLDEWILQSYGYIHCINCTCYHRGSKDVHQYMLLFLLACLCYHNISPVLP